MKLGGREVSLDDSVPFFGKESVAQHLKLSTFYADATGCPSQRARAYGSVKNISRMKLRGLKALVLIGSIRSGDYNGQVQTMDPSDLVPGEESEIFLWLSCDWAGQASTFRTKNDAVLVMIADVAGRTEEVSKPDGSNPFETPAPTKTAAPAAHAHAGLALRKRSDEATLMPDAGASLALMWMDPATGETRKVPLDHALRLGSNRQQNDVALPFAGVEALHAEIVSRPGGGWEIAPVGVLRLKVDGAMVPRAELRPGSTFSIGILDFTVGYAGALPERAGAAARPAATVSGSSRILVPPPVRRPAVAGPRPPEPDRRLTFALLGGGLVAALAAASSGSSPPAEGRRAPGARRPRPCPRRPRPHRRTRRARRGRRRTRSRPPRSPSSRSSRSSPSTRDSRREPGSS